MVNLLKTPQVHGKPAKKHHRCLAKLAKTPQVLGKPVKQAPPVLGKPVRKAPQVLGKPEKKHYRPLSLIVNLD